MSIKFVKILNGWVINYILAQSADLETVYMSPLALDLPRSLIDADRPKAAIRRFPKLLREQRSAFKNGKLYAISSKPSGVGG